MEYSFYSTPKPLTSTAIVYECIIYENEREIGIGNVEANVYGHYNASVRFTKSVKDKESVLEQLIADCYNRAKVVFETGKEESH